MTIKKEIATLWSGWNWATSMGHISGMYPAGKLVFSKSEEKMPFMTWNEIERRVKAGGDPEQLWECLFLNTSEIAELLEFMETVKGPNWLYPMFCMAAHTVMRRSVDEGQAAEAPRARLHPPRQPVPASNCP